MRTLLRDTQVAILDQPCSWRSEPVRIESRYYSFMAVVLNVYSRGDDDIVDFISHDLLRIERYKLDVVHFILRYVPNFELLHGEAATGIISVLSQDLVMMPDVLKPLRASMIAPRFLDSKADYKEIDMGVHLGVYVDHNRHACLLVEQCKGGVVRYIEYDPTLGAVGRQMGEVAFAKRYIQHLSDYPVEKAALLYREYARRIGATAEAIRLLSTIMDISKEEFTMATEIIDTTKGKEHKSSSTRARKPKEPGATTTPKVAKPKAEKPAAAPKTTEPKAEKPAKSGGSASARFQELIMEGKLTDEQIFLKVQAEFDLSDDKRGYVSWYRNNLRKKGFDAPDRIKKDLP